MKGHGRHFFFISMSILLVAGAQLASGHVRVSPGESTAGAEQEYSARVPTERDTATVRVEIEFPADVEVLELIPKSGWTIEADTNTEGRIIGAVWSGGSIPPEEAQEFLFRARNPAEATTLVWRASQVHEDGSRAEWFGPSGSSTPAPMTTINPEP